MSAAVAIPWRGGCEHREAALAWVTAKYEALGLEVVIGTHDTGPWVKALAVADAVSRTDAEILVIADGDAWCDGLPAAIDALGSHPWAMPHDKVHRLTADATANVLQNPESRFQNLELEQLPYRGYDAGGIVVLRRDDWERCPLDARFVGWGHEDQSWGVALRCLLGAQFRGRAPLWHLWHPPQRRLNRRLGSTANQKLARRYRYAARSRALVAALVDEGRPAGGTG